MVRHASPSSTTDAVFMDRLSSSINWKHNRRLCVLALCILVFFALPRAAYSKNAYIDDLLITTDEEHLLLYCRVKNCFTEDMNRAILSGIPTTFTFRIRLERKRAFRFNETLADLRLHHTVKYNTLKNQFLLTLNSPFQDSESWTVREYYAAKSLLTEINGAPLARLEDLNPGADYRLRVRAELNKVRLPFYLHYVLFFVSLWDFQTDWYEVILSYERGATADVRTTP